MGGLGTSSCVKTELTKECDVLRSSVAGVLCRSAGELLIKDCGHRASPLFFFPSVWLRLSVVHCCRRQPDIDLAIQRACGTLPRVHF